MCHLNTEPSGNDFSMKTVQINLLSSVGVGRSIWKSILNKLAHTKSIKITLAHTHYNNKTQ
jgi:hypothetical protein